RRGSACEDDRGRLVLPAGHVVRAVRDLPPPARGEELVVGLAVLQEGVPADVHRRGGAERRSAGCALRGGRQVGEGLVRDAGRELAVESARLGDPQGQPGEEPLVDERLGGRGFRGRCGHASLSSGVELSSARAPANGPATDRPGPRAGVCGTRPPAARTAAGAGGRSGAAQPGQAYTSMLLPSEPRARPAGTPPRAVQREAQHQTQAQPWYWA